MGEAARQLTEQDYASQLSQAQALSARKKSTPQSPQKNNVVAFRPRLNDTAPTAETENEEQGGQVIDFPSPAGSEAEERERLDHNRAQASAQKSSLGFDPNVQRLADGGNIPDTRMEEASNRVSDITQRLRQATTLAQIQALRLEYMQLNDQLAKEGMDDQQQKMIDEARGWWARLIVDGGPLIDDALGGMDFGIGTILADTINGWQFLYGRVLRGDPEPDRLRKFFIPPPLRTTPATNDPQGLSLYKRAMVLWDTIVTVLLWFAQNGFILMILFFSLAVVYIFYSCWLGPDSILRSGTDALCIQFAGVAIKATGAIISP